MTRAHVPAELFDETRRILADVSREIDRFNALQNEIIRLHGIRARERRTVNKQQVTTSPTTSTVNFKSI